VSGAVRALPATPSPRVGLPDHVVRRALPTETALLDLDTGRCYRLAPAQADLLGALLEHGDFRHAAAALAAAGVGEAPALETQLRRLCRGLEALGLLRL